MRPPLENEALAAVVGSCRASRDRCEPLLLQQGCERDTEAAARLAQTAFCVALLSVISDRLELEGDCPADLIDTAIHSARELPPDDCGCAAACNAAADALSEWLDGAYERD